MLKSQTLFLNNIGAPFNRDIMQATYIGLNVLVATLKGFKKREKQVKLMLVLHLTRYIQTFFQCNQYKKTITLLFHAKSLKFCVYFTLTGHLNSN